MASIKKTRLFSGHVRLALPSPLSPFSRKKFKKKKSPFFIHIPIEPGCSEMDIFIKKMSCDMHPRYLYSNYDIYTLYFYGSPYYKDTNLHFRKMLLTKRIIEGMLNIFYILSKKVDFFGGRGVTPPPDSGHVH